MIQLSFNYVLKEANMLLVSDLFHIYFMRKDLNCDVIFSSYSVKSGITKREGEKKTFLDFLRKILYNSRKTNCTNFIRLKFWSILYNVDSHSFKC